MCRVYRSFQTNKKLFKASQRATHNRNMDANMTRALACFGELFRQCGGFKHVLIRLRSAETASTIWPHFSEDTQAYIARTPSLSPLSISLLRDNAAFEGPLYPLLGDYLWCKVRGVPKRQPFTQLDELLTAIAQLQWRERLASVCMVLTDQYLEDEARRTRSELSQYGPWDADVHARFYPCVREFRDHCLAFTDSLGHLEGLTRPLAPTLPFTRHASLAGRDRPRERRWALAAVGIGRSEEAPRYIGDQDVVGVIGPNE